ncbi:hypothetical protein B0H11DRAFT_2220500 [Mycena galericulata]|nr:hypothetical protein B0H11DRAFT_2220500 [Mycena galericulata]
MSTLKKFKAHLSKDQDRLYLTLDHRYSQPGYHWALLLAPKDLPGSGSTEPDAKCWDVTNLTAAHEWQFRDALISQYTAPSLIARILLRLEIRQGDATFTCRVWALDGVEALRRCGLVNILEDRVALEESAVEFADACMALLESGKLDIVTQGASAIPVLDLRRDT